MWKTAFLDKLLVKVFSSLSSHLFIWFEGVRKVFGVFCAGSSHVKNTRLKIFSKYEFTVVSSSCLPSPLPPLPPRGWVVKPRHKGWPPGKTGLRLNPVPLLWVPCAPHPWLHVYYSFEDCRFLLGFPASPAPPQLLEPFLISSVHHWNVPFLVPLLCILRVWAKMVLNLAALNCKWLGALGWQEPGKRRYREGVEAEEENFCWL